VSVPRFVQRADGTWWDTVTGARCAVPETPARRRLREAWILWELAAANVEGVPTTTPQTREHWGELITRAGFTDALAGAIDGAPLELEQLVRSQVPAPFAGVTRELEIRAMGLRVALGPLPSEEG
jgi:hypothetical protein